MSFKSVSIIGLGLIGGSIAKRLKLKKADIEILAYDKEEILNKAYAEKIIDKKLTTYEEAVQSDCCFLCAPADISLKIFEEIYPKLSKNSILTDVCGIKSPFEELKKKLKSDGIYIGGHPMTGKERSGYEYSDPYLFENSVYIITDNHPPNTIINSLYELLNLLGARIKFLDAETHDLMVAYISHLPQLLASTLVITAASSSYGSDSLSFAGGGFRDMTRIASSDYEIWQPIIKFNRKNIQKALSSFVNDIHLVIENLEYANDNFFSALFTKAKQLRNEIPKSTKGFLNPLSDIIISVQDKPGTLLKICQKLYEANLDIKDIELLKVREKIDGVFRISFITKEDAQKAADILRNAGFEAKVF